MLSPEQPPHTFLMRKYWLLFTICTPIGILFLLYLHFSNTGKLPSPIEKFEHYLASIVLANVGGWLAYQIDNLLDKKISWKELFLTRFISGLLVNMIVGLSLTIGTIVFGLKATTAEAWKIGILTAFVLFLYEIFYGSTPIAIMPIPR